MVLSATFGLIAVTLMVVFVLVCQRLHRGTFSSHLLPPGPNVNAPPKLEPWKTYKKWSQEYKSPLIYLNLRGRDIIVNNKLQVALDLLENRNRNLNYSSRPDFPMMDLIGRQDNVGFQRYGPRLKKCRRLLHDALSVRAISEWSGPVRKECDEFLVRLLRSPRDVEKAVLSFVGSMVVQFTYGQKLDSEYLHLIEETAKHSSAAMIPGKWIVDSYPILKYLPAWAPGGSFQTWAADARKMFQEFTRTPFEKVKKQIRDGTATPSFVYRNLVEMDGHGDPEDESILAGTAASLYSAATDTTSTILLTFFLTMVVYPEIQEKAYQEILRVVGTDRLPELSDEGSLPYIQAIIKELHRFNPPVPLMPRSPLEDDIYEEVRIPRKAWMFTNIWAMTHDEEEYPFVDTNTFSPERFMGEKGQGLRDPRDISFGFGRRRCPGVALANAATFLIIARTLAAFRIVPVKDSAGQPVVPPLEFVTSFTTPPKSFQCTVVPRSTAMEDVIGQLS